MGIILLVVLCAVTDWTIRLIVVNAKLSGRNSYIDIMNHCFRIRQLQSEVADLLYQRLRPIDVPYYKVDVQERLETWRKEIPVLQIDKFEHMADWFEHAYHNLTMFIHRPSPANPQPTTEDLQHCFEAASEVIRRYERLLLHVTQLG